jgi:lantibiotic modifying enzyme
VLALSILFSTLIYCQQYVGAAHGIASILHTLLHFPEHIEPYRKLIVGTLDYLLSLRLPSGNYPSSVGSSRDDLVQFCHGAPGVAMVFQKAFEVYKDEKYLKAAEGAAEVVWDRGLLKKGNSLCHGVCGNGYVFLSLFRSTKNPEYLYKALCFAEWSFDASHALDEPDRPYSLMEGIAGWGCFYLDCLNPDSAYFPCFQFPS